MSGMNIGCSPNKLAELGELIDSGLSVTQIARRIKVYPKVVEKLVVQIKEGKLRIPKKSAVKKGRPGAALTEATQELQQQNIVLESKLEQMQKTINALMAGSKEADPAAPAAPAAPTAPTAPSTPKPAETKPTK